MADVALNLDAQRADILRRQVAYKCGTAAEARSALPTTRPLPLRWHVFVGDLWFVVWGLALAVAAVRYRLTRAPRSRPRSPSTSPPPGRPPIRPSPRSSLGRLSNRPTSAVFRRDG